MTSQGKRQIFGNTGHLTRPGGVGCKVDGATSALDLELRKEGRHGRLALVAYSYRPWVGWVREERLSR